MGAYPTSPSSEPPTSAKDGILYEAPLSFLPIAGDSNLTEKKMLTVTDGGSLSRALKLAIDLRLKQLLVDRHDQLGQD